MRIHVAVLLLSFGIAPLVVGAGIAQATPANEAFVNTAFQVVVNHPPNPPGLAFYTQALDSAAASRQQVAQQLLSSTEYRTRAVNSLYQAFLHRNPEPVALNFMLGLLGQNNGMTQVEAVIVSSPEYYQNFGGGTDQGWVSRVYQDALGRSAQPSDVTNWLNALHTIQPPANARPQVAMTIVGSPEGCQRAAALIWKGFPMLINVAPPSGCPSGDLATFLAPAVTNGIQSLVAAVPVPATSPLPLGPGKMVLVGLSNPIAFQSITQASPRSLTINGTAEFGAAQAVLEAWSPTDRWKNHVVNLNASNGTFVLQNVSVTSLTVSGNTMTTTLTFGSLTKR